MLERDLQSRVIDLAKLRGWKVQHIRPARMANGQWRTPIEGHAGGPDLLLARNGMVLLRELKSETGALTKDQKDWAAALGAYFGVWRPSMWEHVIMPTLMSGATFGTDLSAVSGLIKENPQ